MLAVNLTPDESENLIYSRLIQNGFPDQFAKLVTAQSGHETDGWTSNVYLKDNNAFGYGYDGDSYEQDDSVEDNVDTVSDYIKNKIRLGIFPDPATITTADQWAGLLRQAGYYTDSQSNYAAGISRWFNANLKTIAISSGLVIFVSLFLYLLLRK
jgi:hypothetical protein